MPFIYEKIIIGDTEGVEVLGYEGSAKHLSVPEELEGLPVLSLGKHAFTDKNTDLEEVSLPSLTTVLTNSYGDSLAFHDDQKLTKLDLGTLETIPRGTLLRQMTAYQKIPL